MTANNTRHVASAGRSLFQNVLMVNIFLFFGVIPVFWYLEAKVGISHAVASNSMTLIHIACFLAAVALPWIKLPDQGPLTRSQRLDRMVIIWIFICLFPRFFWELPWLFFLEEIRHGVQEGALWSYMWSPYLLGGDARYLNGDPLVVTLEIIAVFVGAFEAWALWKFFVQGKRFTNIQLSFIMAGMIVEVVLPAVYFGVEIANSFNNVASAADLWIKFVLLNSLWCTMPIVTYFWGGRRLATQDLKVDF